jgi:hypothetical protein
MSTGGVENCGSDSCVDCASGRSESQKALEVWSPTFGKERQRWASRDYLITER